MKPTSVSWECLNAVPKRTPHRDVGELVGMLAQLCKWNTPYNKVAKGEVEFRNTAFQGKDDFEGISVIQYLTAPHQHVCGLFQDRLRDAIQAKPPLSVTLQPPKAVSDINPDHVYLLESHPAVTMGFWLADGRFESIEYIPTYKGAMKKKSRTFAEFETKNRRRQELLPDSQNVSFPKDRFIAAMRKLLAKEVLNLARNDLATSIESSEKFLKFIEKKEGEDKLDAFVALLNLVELCCDKGDWFGTVRGGYFLTPRLPSLFEDRLFCDEWDKAERQLETRNWELKEK